jgi:hypothetical protein
LGTSLRVEPRSTPLARRSVTGGHGIDVDIRQLTRPTVETYKQDINRVITSRDQTEYQANRKATGLSKPSIFSGLVAKQVLSVPNCFSLDLMHLLSINIEELLLSTWRGTIKCESTDNKADWDWATFTGREWKTHGDLVEAATKYFPSSFHRPPRNPAEKLNSGYKATEWYLYVFGLGPGFFRALLPEKYWLHFCKLARAVQLVTQRSISTKQIKEAHVLLVQFVEEYEQLYYQRRLDRLHFCRPCIHTLLHIAAEIL